METKKRVIVLSADDWEGIFIDGKLIDEGHRLGEGSNFTYLLKLSEQYNFKYADVKSEYLTDGDIEMTENSGNFPSNLSDFTGYYES